MRDLLPSIKVNVSVEPREFLSKMARIAERAGFTVARRYERAIKSDILSLHVVTPSPHRGLFGQVIADEVEKKAIQIEIRAQRWSPDDHPTYEVYCAEAKAMIGPLLSTYNRESGTRHRLIIPTKESLELKLRPDCERRFKLFVSRANKSILHHFDLERFYDFIRASLKCARYDETELERLLMREGFTEETAEHLSAAYGHIYDFTRRR